MSYCIAGKECQYYSYCLGILHSKNELLAKFKNPDFFFRIFNVRKASRRRHLLKQTKRAYTKLILNFE